MRPVGAQERRRKKLVLGRDLDPLTRQVEDGPAVDDEPGHAADSTRPSTPSSSGVEGREVEAGEACGVEEDVHGRDPPVPHREGADREDRSVEQ